MDIEANLAAYLGAREASERYASTTTAKITSRSRARRGVLPLSPTQRRLNMSCLHLGFYLASEESFEVLRGRSVPGVW